MWTGLVWLRVGSCERLFWNRVMNDRFQSYTVRNVVSSSRRMINAWRTPLHEDVILRHFRQLSTSDE